jgi:hypothetical protein
VGVWGEHNGTPTCTAAVSVSTQKIVCSIDLKQTSERMRGDPAPYPVPEGLCRGGVSRLC